MATLMASHIDIEQGCPRHCSTPSSDLEEEIFQFHGEENSLRDSCKAEIVEDKNGKRSSSSSSSSSSCPYESTAAVADLDGGCGGDDEAVETTLSVHSAKVERDCRICHLSLDGSNPESGFPIELGCSCKDDLAAAHRQCAEAWFKIRGNKTCEICGSTARNVVGVNEVELTEEWNNGNEMAAAAATAAQRHVTETRHFWQGHRFLNFLLACMVFAFVISWLFHFNVPS